MNFQKKWCRGNHLLPIFCCWAWCYMVWNTILVNSGHLSQLCPLPTSCSSQAYSWVGTEWGTEKASTVQQQLKHWCHSLNPQHHTSAMKMNSISAWHDRSHTGTYINCGLSQRWRWKKSWLFICKQHSWKSLKASLKMTDWLFHIFHIHFCIWLTS